MKQKKYLAIVGSMLLALTACSGGGSELDPTPSPTPSAKVPISISTSISRATDLAFETGDQIGLFVVNHKADGSVATLQTTGNHVDNMKFTYDGTWKAASPTYWKDNSTHADFYIYYPYTSSISYNPQNEMLPFHKTKCSETQNEASSL